MAAARRLTSAAATFLVSVSAVSGVVFALSPHGALRSAHVEMTQSAAQADSAGNTVWE